MAQHADRVHIQNDTLEVQILLKGAQLCSVRNKQSNFEFIWQAGQIWPRHAPNLFPVIGSLLDHEYVWEGKTYRLSHHGFARDHTFTLLQQSEHAATFLLEPNEEIRQAYPFPFQLLISYVLCENVLEQRFRVINAGSADMPFSIGGHPAFNVTDQSAYRVVLDEPEERPSMRLQGPYVREGEIQVMHAGVIDLSPEVFMDDALMFQGLTSKNVRLEHRLSSHAVHLHIPDWPYLGIWAKPGAAFVCIEPWDGLADRVGHNKQLVQKEGIRILGPGATYRNRFSMKFETP